MTATTSAPAVLSNGESVVRVVGTLTYAADVDRMDPEAAAVLWPDLTFRDTSRIMKHLRRTSQDGLVAEWYEDFIYAVRWNLKAA